MALNCAMLDGDRNPIPLPNEMTVMTIDSGVDLVLTIPDMSGEGPKLRSLKASGRAWITDQRFLFTSGPNSGFDSLSIPLHAILSTKFEQPTFSGNYLSLEIHPSRDGGLTNGTQLEVRLKNQAMFQFVALLEKARERAIYMKREVVQDAEDGPPRYDSPAGTSISLQGGPGPSSDNAEPAGAPPGYDA
ncbi:hypothetical protein BDZ89DRAFT_1114038 [Hymenopellis radicata]|nr:hypothetical protein BDZ89DRAFT_1114038 [Hymenopellis radicata]